MARVPWTLKSEREQRQAINAGHALPIFSTDANLATACSVAWAGCYDNAGQPVSFETIQARGKMIVGAPRLLDVAEEIANDPRCDLVLSERRIRLYHAIDQAGGKLDNREPGLESIWQVAVHLRDALLNVASRIDKGSGAAKWTADQHEALTDLIAQADRLLKPDKS